VRTELVHFYSEGSRLAAHLYVPDGAGESHGLDSPVIPAKLVPGLNGERESLARPIPYRYAGPFGRQAVERLSKVFLFRKGEIRCRQDA